jgi:hypothetical protein
MLIMLPPMEKRASEIAEHIREVEMSSAGLGLAIRFHHLPAAKPPVVAAYSGPEEFISLNVQPYVPYFYSPISRHEAHNCVRRRTSMQE